MKITKLYWNKKDIKCSQAVSSSTLVQQTTDDKYKYTKINAPKLSTIPSISSIFSDENLLGIEENLDILLGYLADLPNEPGGFVFVIIITYNETTY